MTLFTGISVINKPVHKLKSGTGLPIISYQWQTPDLVGSTIVIYTGPKNRIEPGRDDAIPWGPHSNKDAEGTHRISSAELYEACPGVRLGGVGNTPSTPLSCIPGTASPCLLDTFVVKMFKALSNTQITVLVLIDHEVDLETMLA